MIDARRLDRVNWDFPGSGNRSDSIHSLHWFPGNFPGQIPAALIQILTAPGETVLDPFCGSGTTGIEAAALGRRSIMSDRMSVASLVTDAKIAILEGVLSKGHKQAIAAQLAFPHACRSIQLGLAGEGSEPLLQEWYAPGTLAQLRFLYGLVEAQPARERDVLKAVFSETLFLCASTSGSPTRSGKRRRHHWGWIADNVRPRELTEKDAVTLFAQKVMSIPSAAPVNFLPRFIRQDARR